MRRLSLLLLFLLLLGAGLFVLFWLDRRVRPPVIEPPAPTPVAPVPTEQAQGFQLGGRFQATNYDEVTKHPTLRVESDDTRTEADVDVFEGVTIEVLDPEELGAVRMRLRAVRARPRRVEATGDLTPHWEPRMDLEGVRTDILSGTSLAPIAFETATALIDSTDPKARRLSGEEPFTAKSTELVVTGRGFEWDVDQTRLVIQHEGHVELLRPGAPPATFTAVTGAIEVTRPEGPMGPVALETSDGAVIELGASSPGRLTARHVRLTARPGPAGTELLALERMDADGDVDWTSGDARFQGQNLSAAFTANTRLERARLEGAPRAEFTLARAPGVIASADPADQRRVVLENQDVLELTWKDGGYALHVESLPPAPGEAPAHPPTVVTRDFRLQSASAIDGWLAEDQRTARFEAGGGVIVTSGEATLETAAFSMSLGPDERGESVLIGKASGGARLEGKLPAEPGDPNPPRTFTLTSPDGLTIERSASGWRVIEGSRVEVALEDPQGFHARAEHLVDFVVPRSGSGALEPAGLKLVARGDVQVDGEAGHLAGEGQKIHLAGEELEILAVAPVRHFVLRGTPAAKAVFKSELGEASALEVELTGDTLYARGAVSGSAELGHDPRGPVRVTFAGDDLTLDHSESGELLPGERLRTVRVVVEGHTQGSVVAGGETLVFHGARFSGERRVRLIEGAPELELGALFQAEGNVRVDYTDGQSDLGVDCEHFEAERTGSDVETGFRQLTASGNVRFQGRFSGKDEADVGGECEVFTFGADRHGSLEALPHGRVYLIGRVPQVQAPFRLAADHVDFEIGADKTMRLLALRPELRMFGRRARAEHLTVDAQQGVVLEGDVRLSGATSSQVPFTLDADEIVLVGRPQPAAPANPDPEAQEDVEDHLSALVANGNVDFRLSDSLRARGERLVIRRASGLLRLEGSPATFDLGSTRFETEWVEFDPVLQLLVGTGRGRMLSAVPAGETGQDWTLEFLSISSLLEPDSVVLVLQEPLFRAPASRSALRASWGIFWLNRDALEDLDRRGELLGGLQDTLKRLRSVPQAAQLSDILALFRTAELSSLLREVYFEGPVEVLAEDELLARADAIYLDAASQHGWLAHATVNLGRQFIGQRQEKLIVRADWLRISSDASLRADHATVTSCSFDEPHVQVVTGNLKILPLREQGKAQYELVLKDNGIEAYNFLHIPLPTIDVATDEDLKPLWPTLSLANSARFGTLFSFAFTRPAYRLGKIFDSFAHFLMGKSSKPEVPPAPAPTAEAAGAGAAPPAAEPRPRRSGVDSNYKIDGSYLGSRGGLLDLGLEIESKNDYWFDLYLGLVVDTGEDRGFIRVPEDQRDTLRRWLRSQAYFDRGKNAWTISYTDQSDAGVQSEFFEGRFLRYERSENYVQWRRSSDENFAQATVKLRIDQFRTDVDELPSLSAYHGRTPLLQFGPLALLYTSDARADYLRRRQGTDPHSPFELGPTFDDVDPEVFGSLDGFGEREVLRFDTNQVLELPVALGAGWKLTPFVSARATAWSEGEDQQDTPTRFVAEGGARLGTSYWTRGPQGALHQVAPFVEYSSELERKDSDGVPVVYDAVERFVSADVVRVGSRARFGVGPEGSLLDLDLAGAYASGRSDQQPDGWLPAEVFARFLIEPFGHQFTVFHEGRYDLETSQTDYSLVSVATHLGEEWGVQLSHQRGRDADGQPLFEAASIAGLYRWTEKWEFEGRESFSLLEDTGLDTRFVLRRYAHDLVLEIDSSVREGEGSSFGISVKPRFGYTPPRVGYVPW